MKKLFIFVIAILVLLTACQSKKEPGRDFYYSEITNATEGLAHSPRSAALFMRRGTAYYKLAMNELAAADFGEALRLNPTLRDAHYYRGMAEYSLGDLDAAESDLESAVAMTDIGSKQSAPFLTGLARIRIAQGDTNAAVLDLDAAIEADVFYTEAYLVRADLSLAQGRSDLAVSDLKAATELNPRDVTNLVRLGGLLVEQKRYEEALKALRSAMKVSSRSPEANFYSAKVYFELGDILKARKYAVVAAEGNTGDPAIYELYGDVLTASRDHDTAITNYLRALSYAGVAPQAYYGLGIAYYSSGDYVKAFESFDEALKRDGSILNTFNNNGYVYTGLSEYDESMRYWSQRTNDAAMRNHALLNLGFACYVTKLFPEAIFCYTEAIEDGEKTAVAYYFRGLAYYEAADNRKSAEDFKRSFDLGFTIARKTYRSFFGDD